MNKFQPGDQAIYVGTADKGLVFKQAYTVLSTNHHALSLKETGDQVWFEENWFISPEEDKKISLEAVKNIQKKNE